tara:strand:+ start:1479 stop:1712 length:234 start_codon:yes stop_codon:yes gene_type:complete
MKLTNEEIKQIIQEEIKNIIFEQEDTNVIVDKAQKAASQEAANIIQKIKNTAAESEGTVSLDMLINIIVQELEKLKK